MEKASKGEEEDLSDMSSSFIGQDVAHCGHCLTRQMARAPLPYEHANKNGGAL